MQSFLGNIDFVKKIIYDLSQIVKPLQDMIKKDTVTFEWNQKEKEAFTKIKQAIVESTVLFSPNFNKDFMLYTSASYSSLVAILTQKDHRGFEWSWYHLWV